MANRRPVAPDATGQLTQIATGDTIDPAVLPVGSRFDLVRRTGATAETFSRQNAPISNAATALVTGNMQLAAIPLLKGTVVTTITFLSGNTAAGTPLNQWFGLYSLALAKLGVTADDTTTAWAANSEKTLTLASPYTVLADALFYVTCMVTATTVPSLLVAGGNSVAYGLAPALAGRDTTHTSLTTPAGAPATAALTAGANLPYAWIA